MAIFLTLLNNFIMVSGIELFILMGMGTTGASLLIAVPILFISFVLFTLFNHEIILSHLLISNITGPILLFLVIAILGSFRPSIVVAHPVISNVTGWVLIFVTIGILWAVISSK